IELERKIAFDNHEIHKFNSNIQTWEETRQNIGEETTADENRLHFNMIGQASKSAEAETENKNQPENQHGKLDSPKRKTEQINESENINQESVLNQEIESLTGTLESIYSRAKIYMLSEIERYKERHTGDFKSAALDIKPRLIELDHLKKEMQMVSNKVLAKGYQYAKEEI